MLKGNSRLYVKNNLQVSFAPVKALEWKENDTRLASFSIIPKFNSDGKYYSQAFSTDYEGTDPDSKLRSEYKSRLKELSTEILSG